MTHKFITGIDVLFTYDGHSYVGQILSKWRDYAKYQIICEDVDDKHYLDNVPEENIIKVVSPDKVYIVTHIIEGDLASINTYKSEYAAKDKVDAILNEVMHNSNEKTYVTMFKGSSGFGWQNCELGEWGNVFFSESKICYEAYGNVENTL